MVQVVDTGVGMQEKDSQRLFKIFSRIKFKNNLNQVGFGIGLTVSKSITEALGGGISVISEQGKGSNFIAYFDISKENEIDM
jgi:signal transduction histidine kinase